MVINKQMMTYKKLGMSTLYTRVASGRGYATHVALTFCHVDVSIVSPTCAPARQEKRRRECHDVRYLLDWLCMLARYTREPGCL